MNFNFFAQVLDDRKYKMLPGTSASVPGGLRTRIVLAPVGKAARESMNQEAQEF